jgi:hypothetical protein
MGWDWVQLVRRPLTGLLYQPRMIDEECGAVVGMRISKGNRSTRRKPAPVPFCPPKILQDLTRARTRACFGGKPATNCLSYGSATIFVLISPLSASFSAWVVHFVFLRLLCIFWYPSDVIQCLLSYVTFGRVSVPLLSGYREVFLSYTIIRCKQVCLHARDLSRNTWYVRGWDTQFYFTVYKLDLCVGCRTHGDRSDGAYFPGDPLLWLVTAGRV